MIRPPLLKKIGNLALGILVWALGANTASAQCTPTWPSSPACSSNPVNFSLSGSGCSGATILWDFGNGQTSNSPSTSQSLAPGTYNVTVTINGQQFSNSLTVTPPPTVSFTSPNSPQCYLTQSFSWGYNITPGAPLQSISFLTGDGGNLSGSGTSGTLGPYTYINPIGGSYSPSIDIIDQAGCRVVQSAPSVNVHPDPDADFIVVGAPNCDSSDYIFTNITGQKSGQTQADYNSFTWTYGDPTGKELINGWSPSYRYQADGTFNVRLQVLDKNNCPDEVTKQVANIDLVLDVKNLSGDTQCIVTQQFQFSHPPVTYPGKNVQWLWEFGDPPSQNLNVDDKSWVVTHDFTGLGPYDVSLQVYVPATNQICVFDTVVRVHVKGPVATIESKTLQPQWINQNTNPWTRVPNTSVIADTMRYQCQIKDTVYFTNVSQYWDNDSEPFNDTLRIDYPLKRHPSKVGRLPVPYPAGNVTDNMGFSGTFDLPTDRWPWTVAPGIPFWSNTPLDGDLMAYVTRTNDHTTRVWDFDDAQAPNCTTNSKLNQNTYDANGKWINCRYSNDSLPKHWYTPGFERCYTVRLRLQDVVAPAPLNCISEASVPLALMAPDASGVRFRIAPCYGNPRIYGIEMDLSGTQPSCDRQAYFINFDSLGGANNWVPQTATLVGSKPGTPWMMATLGLPPNAGTVIKQYSPGEITDRKGWVTVGVRIQSGKDPKTGQPCIDDHWYDSAYRYLFYDPSFTATPNKGCKPLDVDVRVNNPVVDSLLTEVWSWGDNTFDVDSNYKFVFDPKTGNYINYRIRYRFDYNSNNPVTVIDSLVTRITDANSGLPLFIAVADTAVDQERQHRFEQAGRYPITHTIVVRQRYPVPGDTVVLSSECFDTRGVPVVAGFYKSITPSTQVVCRGQDVTFTDSFYYWFLNPPPFGPELDPYEWWYDGTPPTRQYPDGSTRPTPPLPGGYERKLWNFDDGFGWVSSVPKNPTRAFPRPGQYNVRVALRDSSGCWDTASTLIRVTGVTADFSVVYDPNNCNPLVKFTNQSVIQDPCVPVLGTTCDSFPTIGGFDWNFGDSLPGNASISILPNPDHIYLGFGEYQVKFKVTTALGCEDSLIRTISISGPRPRFEVLTDTVGCVSHGITLRNNSIDPRQGATFTWNFGDGSAPVVTTTEPSISHVYNTPGTYEVYLYQRDSTQFGGTPCTDTFPNINAGQKKIIITVLPIREADFSISDTVVCVNELIELINLSDTIYDQTEWVLGDGTTITGDRASNDTVTHAYQNAGFYTIFHKPTYTPTPPFPACAQTAFRTIEVRDIQANFTIDSSNVPAFRFTNTSRNANRYRWTFGDGGEAICPDGQGECPNAAYDYANNLGPKLVCLYAENDEGCTDSICQLIDNNFIREIKVYNVFTPGTVDNKNDVFRVEIRGQVEYEISIINRYGSVVFKETDPSKPWNGKINNTGPDCPAGVYFVKIKYKFRAETEEKTYNGSVTLIRD